MDTIEINGQQRSIIYRHTILDEENYSGTEVVITSYNGNIVKFSNSFECDIDEAGNPFKVYTSPIWDIEIISSLVELL